MKYTLTKGQLSVISSVLSNLAAGWIGSLVIFPGLIGIHTVSEALFLLSYSIPFALLAMYFAAKIEEVLV